MSIDHLEALERRGDQLERFYNARGQAADWIRQHGTQSLVDDLRRARTDKRPMRMGTINILILLAHIDRLEHELAKVTLVKP